MQNIDIYNKTIFNILNFLDHYRKKNSIDHVIKHMIK